MSEVLGHGGFGVVLKAFDPALGRAVAIKVLAPQLATSAAARGRFAREARAAAAVVHENVVAIHAVDSWKNLPYLVMPYIAGQSLQERVDRDGPMELKAILRIGIQTAQGLASAHAQGLVHRDVKPVEHPARKRRGASQAHRFRPGTRGRRRESHAKRRRGRNTSVHVARASPGRGRRSSIATSSAWEA